MSLNDLFRKFQRQAIFDPPPAEACNQHILRGLTRYERAVDEVGHHFGPLCDSTRKDRRCGIGEDVLEEEPGVVRLTGQEELGVAEEISPYVVFRRTVGQRPTDGPVADDGNA